MLHLVSSLIDSYLASVTEDAQDHKTNKVGQFLIV